MKLITIEGGRIEEVWFKTIKACVELGHNYVIDKGEYEGTQRREFDLATLRITSPGIRPLACQSQSITPTTDEEIEKYFQNYLMNPDFDDPEEEKRNEYKYATWIAPMWQACCDMLVQGEGGCNQATISTTSQMPELKTEIEEIFVVENVLNPPVSHQSRYIIKEAWIEDTTLKQPPCLRVIDMRIRYGKLHFFVYFRSWDLIAGLPENLGGIQLLKEWCLDYINAELSDRGKPLLQDGEIIAMSKGLHIYDHFWDMAKEYVGEESSALEIPGVHVIGA